ncbi:MAG: hypothetical protein QMC96_12290, partial [Methanomicrobiales archaeon]|nr:hypothetical protein [Methanomicrobiales archaeon]
SATEDTVLYLYYDPDHADNDTYVGAIGSIPGRAVWSNGYAGVWHMKPSGGLVLDSTANANHGTIYGATVTQGPLGRCLSYDDIDDKIEVYPHTGLTGVTNNLLVQVYFKTPDHTDRLGLAAVWSGGISNLAWFFEISGPVGTIRFAASQTNPTYSVWAWPNVVLDNTWHTLAVLWAAGNHPDLYIDGQKQTRASDGALITSICPIDYKFEIGAMNRYFYGDMAALHVLSDTPSANPAWIAATNAALTDTLVAYTADLVKMGVGTVPPARVVVWGDNEDGQRDVPEDLIAVQIASGSYHTLALRSNGTVVAWGQNDDGQCDVPDGLIAVQVAAGAYHSLALREDGTVLAWGQNYDAQCDVPPGLVATQVDGGMWHSIALRADGSVVAWGNNADGQCNVPPGLVAIRIAAGDYHSLAIREDGTVVAWGDNSSGQCDVPDGLIAVQVAAGVNHSLALKADGSVVAWGSNLDGQCNVPPDLVAVHIAAGSYHSLAIKEDRLVVAWGWNYKGQCTVTPGLYASWIDGGELHAVAVVGPPPTEPVTGWGFPKAKITIDHTQVDEDSTIVPLKVVLSTTGLGLGRDLGILVTAIGSNWKKLAIATADGMHCYVGVAEWDPSTGHGIVYVNVPAVSATEDTVLYLYYDPDHADNDTYVGGVGSSQWHTIWTQFMALEVADRYEVGWGFPKLVIGIDGYGTLWEDITEFPIAVILRASSGQTGADLRPVMTTLGTRWKKMAVATADGTPCPVEVTEWDPSTGFALFFVKVPYISAAGDTPLYFYYDPDHADNDTYVGAIGSIPGQAVWPVSRYEAVWHMKADGGLVKDSTANGNDGTLHNVETVDGPFGKCLHFNGTDAKISTGKSTVDLGIDGINNTSVHLWAYPALANGGGLFECGTEAAGQEFGLRTVDGVPGQFLAQHGGGAPYDYTFDSGYAEFDRWLHVALDILYDPSYDVSSDAWCQGKRKKTVYQDYTTGTAKPFEIGHWSDQYFGGRIAEFRIERFTTDECVAWTPVIDRVFANYRTLADAMQRYAFLPPLAILETGWSVELYVDDWVALHGDLPTPLDILEVRVRDAFNRFARTAAVLVADPDGSIAAASPPGTPILLYCSETGADPFLLRFGGFVIDPKTDADTTTLELLSFDFWLKKRIVYYGFAGSTVSAALQYLIETYTPLAWNPSAVQVVNDVTFTREWKGTPLDEVIAELAALSADEEFGADDTGTFFFRPRSVNRSPRDFPEGDYYEAEFDEDARAQVNRVTLYYGEYPDTGAIAVQDKKAQLVLQERFGSPRPVVIEITRVYPEIATEDAARAKARQILDEKRSIRTGELRTWNAFAVRPGDVCRVEVEDQQVDGEFRVAQIEYFWPDGETAVRLAENAEGVVDVLVEISDEVSRIDARAADLDATLLEVVGLETELEIETELAVYITRVLAAVFLCGDPAATSAGALGDTAIGGGALGDAGARERVI